MKVVVDTNRLISAAIVKGTTREILLSKNFDFFTVECAILELKRHAQLIMEKSRIDKSKLEDLFDLILGEMNVVGDWAVRSRCTSSRTARPSGIGSSLKWLPCWPG
jgi:predicted nucleic acid-binding protein